MGRLGGRWWPRAHLRQVAYTSYPAACVGLLGMAGCSGLGVGVFPPPAPLSPLLAGSWAFPGHRGPGDGLFADISLLGATWPGRSPLRHLPPSLPAPLSVAAPQLPVPGRFLLAGSLEVTVSLACPWEDL